MLVVEEHRRHKMMTKPCVVVVTMFVACPGLYIGRFLLRLFNVFRGKNPIKLSVLLQNYSPVNMLF